MNRREFLHTVGGAAMLSGAYTTGLEAAGELLQSAPRAKTRAALLFEPTFPAADATPAGEDVLRKALVSFELSVLGADELRDALSRDRFEILITPYGSAFPKHAWPSIRAFLDSGGNWLNLGGVPCAVPVVRTGSSWRQEIRQTAYHRTLGITQAFPVSIPAGVDWRASAKYPWTTALVNQVRCSRVHEFYVRFSRAKQIPEEDGSDGLRDAIIEPLLSVTRSEANSGRPPMTWTLAAPVVMVDRMLGDGAGGRWIFVTGDGSVAPGAIGILAEAAAAGCRRLALQPTHACCHSGEAASITASLIRPGMAADQAFVGSLKIDVFNDRNEKMASAEGSLGGTGSSIQRTDTFDAWREGYYRVEARLTTGERSALRATTGVWVFDEHVLAKGSALTADAVSLRQGGKPFPVTGTTYMASDVHRQFLIEPNPEVWERDFAAMKQAGVNVVRTGLWTGWSKYMTADGAMNEAALRALDAFMLTAAKHDIGVVFTFFAFLPPAFGGSNPYLDPRSVDTQKRFVNAIVRRFGAMKNITWDLINEPSFCSADQLWFTRPNYDEHEQRAWEVWLADRYPAETPEARALQLQELWRGKPGDAIGLPAIEDFEDSNLVGGRRPLKALDYRLFAQDMFRRWVNEMAAAVREVAAPGHLITVGQDEGGTGERPSNHFFGPSVDLTSVHTWWYNDDLLWDAVVSKHPARANLVQETGVMFYETAEGRAWRTEAEVRDLFERKLALAIGAGGAGYINWIWNTNPYMPSDNEAAIGLLRPDGSAKPEFDVWRGMTEFVRSAAPYFEGRRREQVLMIVPQANLFSVRTTAVEATKRAVRWMHYCCRVPMAAVGEFNIEAWPERPKLIVLPSPRILTRNAWSLLRAWMEQGSALLVTGPFDEDEHWLPTGRMREIGLTAATRAVMGTEFVAGDSGAARLSFRGERIQRIETAMDGLAGGGAGYRIDPVGKGSIIWVAAPLELAVEEDFAIGVYRDAVRRAGAGPAVVDVDPDDSSLLVYPAQYRDCTLYTVISESQRAWPQVRFRPAGKSGPGVSVQLGAGRAALVLVDRVSGAIVADYPRGSAARTGA